MRRYLIAIAIGLLIITGMFLLEHHMRALVEEQAAQGVVISFPEIILLRIVGQWMHWKIFLLPVILAACIGIAVMTDLLKPRPR